MDLGGGNGMGQDPAMEAGGDSAGGTATIRGDTASTEAREAAPSNFFGGRHTRRLAESGWRPEPTPLAYRGECVTGQAPCYAEMHTVSPVRIHSPVRSIPTPRICRARMGIQPGRMVPAQRSWSPVCLLSPGYPAPALRTVSPVRFHSPVGPVPAPALAGLK